jgi:hypothetical protein
MFASLHPLWCHICLFANSTLITSFLIFPFLPSSFLASLSSPVSFSFLVSVQLFFCHVGDLLVDCTLINLVTAFLLTVGASLLYCMHVHAAWYSSCFRSPGVQYRLYHGWAGVSLLPYRMHVHTAWYGSFCTPAVQYSCLYHFAVIAVSHVFVFANSSIRLSLLSLLFFPLSC